MTAVAALDVSLPGLPSVLGGLLFGWIRGAAAVTVVLLAWSGAGGPVRRWVGPAPHAVTLLAGIAVLGLAALAFAQIGLVRPAFLAFVAALAVAAGAPTAWRAVRPLRTRWTTAPRAARLAVVLIVAAAIAVSRIPFALIDARFYHLGLPEEILRRGRWVANPWEWTWELPSMAEMGFLPAYALGGITGARAVGAATLAALLLVCGETAGLLAVSSEGIRASPSTRLTASWTAAALLAGCGLPFRMVCDLKNDLAAALAVGGVALAAVRCANGAGTGWWVLLGGGAGLAAATKLTSVVPAGALVLATLVVARRNGRWSVGVASCAAAAAVILGPWLAQNGLLTGNPVVPFAAARFGGLHWSIELERGIAATAAKLEGMPEISPRAWISNLLLFGAPRFGSFLVGLLLPLAMARGSGRGGAALRLGGVAGFLVFLFVAQRPRYLLPWLPVAAALAGAGWVLRPARPGWRRGAGVLVVAAAWMALTPLWDLLPAEWPGVLAGRMTPAAFTARTAPAGAELAERLRSHASRDDQVLVLCEQRTLGLRCRVLGANMITASPVRWAAEESADPGRLAVRFRQLGITLVAHNLIRTRFQSLFWYAGLPWSDRALRVYREFAAGYWTLIGRPAGVTFEGGGFYVWRVNRIPHPPAYPLLALPGTEGLMTPLIDCLSKGGASDALAAEALPLARRLAERVGPVLDAEDWIAMTLCTVDRGREALRMFDRERRLGYVNERNQAWHAAVLRTLGRNAEAASIEAEVLAASGGDSAALLRHPLLERIFPVPR